MALQIQPTQPVFVQPTGPVSPATVTPTSIGTLIFPPSAAENAAGVAIVNGWYPYGNMLRYGIVPNSAGAAAANTAIAKALFNPAITNGPSGQFWFPNTTGADVYYFNGVISFRDGVRLNLMGSTLSYTGAVGAADVNSGFLFSIRDFSVENGSISVAVDTSLASSSGNAIQIGARGSESTYFTNMFDSLLAAQQGNCVVRNCRITVNNTGSNLASTGIIAMTGGLANVIIENNVLDGTAAANCAYGTFYEFGWATSPPSTNATQTSHAHNVIVRNNKVSNCGTGIYFGGSYSTTVESNYVRNCPTGIAYAPGEAMFFNPWVGWDDTGAKRNFAMRNNVVEGCTVTGLSLTGTGSGSTYLTGLTSSQKVDLMDFIVEGGALGGTGNGVVCTSPLCMRGVFSNCTGSGGNIGLSEECVQFDIGFCTLIGSNGPGIRADLGGNIWPTPRLKIGTIHDNVICGGNAQAITINNSASIHVARNRIGYNALYDSVGNESTQGTGVYVDAGASGVVCDSNYITIAGGGSGYQIAGTTSANCNIINPMGPASGATGTGWAINGMASDTAANIASAAAFINTHGKYFLKQCWDSTNSRLMIAQGAGATDNWIIAGFGTTQTTITPS